MKYILFFTVLLLLLLQMANITARSSSFSVIEQDNENIDNDYNMNDIQIHNDDGNDVLESSQTELPDNSNMNDEEYLPDELLLLENDDITFNPTGLTYKDCPLSITAAQEFEITNMMSSSVIIFSITSNNNQFYSIVTTPIEILSYEKYYIKILYLPIRVENIEIELSIMTSRGEYKYAIIANSILNSYRINPQLGIRFPSSNNILEKPIIIYNPHQDTLYITEIFTTEEFLSLKDINLYSTDQPASQNSLSLQNTKTPQLQVEDEHENRYLERTWSIESGIEKEIIILSVTTDLNPGFHSGFLHIKTNYDNIVMPIEMEILNTFIYPQHEELNFGVLTRPTERVSQDVYIINSSPVSSDTSGSGVVEVIEIIPVDADPNLTIELVPTPYIYPTTTSSGSSSSNLIAKLYYTGVVPGIYSNKLLIITNNTNAINAVLEVRYTAQVVHGSIRYDIKQTFFLFPIYNNTYIDKCQHCTRSSSSTSSNIQLNTTHRNLLLTEYTHAIDHNMMHTKLPIIDQTDNILIRYIELKNLFHISVAIIDIKQSNCDDIIYIPYNKPTRSELANRTLVSKQGIVAEYMQPWKSIALFLRYALVAALYSEDDAYLPRTCYIDVTTNISVHRIPVYLTSMALSIDYMDVPMIEDFEPNPFSSVDSPIATTASTNSTSSDSIGFDTIPTVSPMTHRTNSNSNENPHSNSLKDNKNQGATSINQNKIQIVENSLYNNNKAGSDEVYNNDIYHINMGNQSVYEPKTIYLVIANNNPYKVPVSIAQASYEACVCTERTWPIGIGGVEANDSVLAASVITALSGRTWMDGVRDTQVCACPAPMVYASQSVSESSDDTIYSSTSSSNSSSSSNMDITASTSASTSTTSTTTNASRSNSTTTRAVAYETIPSHHSVFSISLRDLSQCRLFPTKLQGFYSKTMTECRSLPSFQGHNNTSINTTTDTTTGIDTGKSLQNNDESTVRVELQTPYQCLQLHLHFKAKMTRLHTYIAPMGVDQSMGGQYIIGQSVPLTLRTRSFFQEPLQELRLNVVPNRVFELEYDNSVISSTNPKSWYIGVHARNICGGRLNGILHQFTIPVVRSVPGRLASDESLHSISLWRCAYNLLTELNFTDPFNTSLLNILHQEDISMLSTTTTISPADRFDSALQLKDAWLMYFPSGVPLPPAVVYAEAAQTTHAYRINNATLQSPHMYTPHSYTVHIPTARIGALQWFYIQVHNPYEVPVTFSLLDEGKSEPSKRMRTLGGMYFQPSGLEARTPPHIVSALSRYQCTGTKLGRNVGISRTPIPCECRNINFKRMNETFCEVDFSKPIEVTESMDDRMIPRSRSLSLVQHALVYTAAAGSIPGLSKLFAADIRTDYTTSSSSASKSGSIEEDVPFLPQSTLAARWTAPPRSTVHIGPILYAPRHHSNNQYTTDTTANASSTSGSIGIKSSFFLFNNFTGFDKVDIYTSSGSAKLSLQSIATCTTEYNTNVSNHCSNVSEILTSTMMNSSDIMPIVVTQQDNMYRVRIQNIGTVVTTIHDIKYDGISCKHSNRVDFSTVTSIYALYENIVLWWQTLWYKMSVFKKPTVLDICTQLPIEIHPQNTYDIVLNTPKQCEFVEIYHQLHLYIDTDYTMRTGDLGNAQTIKPNKDIESSSDSILSFPLLFQLSPEMVSVCLYQASNGRLWWLSYAWYVVYVVIAMAVAAQCLYLYLRTNLQGKKYKHAQQALTQHIHKQSKRTSSTSGTSVPCSPMASFSSPHSNSAVEALKQVPVPTRWSSNLNSEHSSLRSGASSSSMFDLSDVMVAEEPIIGIHNTGGNESTSNNTISALQLKAVQALYTHRAAILSTTTTTTTATIEVSATLPRSIKSAAKLSVNTSIATESVPVISKLISPSTVSLAGQKPAFTEEISADAAMSPTMKPTLREHRRFPSQQRPVESPTALQEDLIATPSISNITSTTTAAVVDSTLAVPIKEEKGSRLQEAVVTVSSSPTSSTSSSAETSSSTSQLATPVDEAVVHDHMALEEAQSSATSITLSTDTLAAAVNIAGGMNASSSVSSSSSSSSNDSTTPSTVAQSGDRDISPAATTVALSVAERKGRARASKNKSKATTEPPTTTVASSSIDPTTFTTSSSTTTLKSSAGLQESTKKLALKDRKHSKEKNSAETATVSGVSVRQPSSILQPASTVLPAPASTVPTVLPASVPTVPTVPPESVPTLLPSVSIASAPAVLPPTGKSKASRGNNKNNSNHSNTDSKAITTADATKSTITTVEASKVSTTASSGKLSPVRLQRSISVESNTNMSEDSPVFRYSGQLLDPTRDSSTELTGLLSGDTTPVPVISQSYVPHFPIGVTGAALPATPNTASEVPHIAGATAATTAVPVHGQAIIGKDESLLLDGTATTTGPLSQLWSRKADSLGLDLDLDLDLTQPLAQASPQDILNTRTGSELRIGADPFFSTLQQQNRDSLGNTSNSIASAGSRHSEGGPSRGGYLSDLMATAQQSIVRTALDTDDSQNLGLSTDWWAPSTTLSAADNHPHIPSTADHHHPMHGVDWMGRDPYAALSGAPSQADYLGHHPVRQDPLHPNTDVYGGHHGGSHAPTGLYHSAHHVGPYFDRVDRHNRHDRPVALSEHDLTNRYRPMGTDPSATTGTSSDIYLRSRIGSIGNRQHSAPIPHSTHNPTSSTVQSTLMSHSHDFIDDLAMEESANSWIQDLTQLTEVEHHRPYRGTATLPAPPGMTRPPGMRSPRRERHHHRQQAPAATVIHNPTELYRHPHSYTHPQQQSEQQQQHYSQQRTAVVPQQQQGYVNPLPQDSTEYNLFFRPDTFPQPVHSNVRIGSGSPGRQTAAEIDQWMSLNASPLRTAGPGAGSSLLLSPQTRPLSSAAHPQQVQYASPHLPASDHAAAVAADLQFFHPNSFFGEFPHNSSSMPLESLEDEQS